MLCRLLSLLLLGRWAGLAQEGSENCTWPDDLDLRNNFEIYAGEDPNATEIVLFQDLGKLESETGSFIDSCSEFLHLEVDKINEANDEFHDVMRIAILNLTRDTKI